MNFDQLNQQQYETAIIMGVTKFKGEIEGNQIDTCTIFRATPFRQPPVTATMMPQQQETPVEAPKVASLGGQDKLTLLPDYTQGPTAQ